MAKAKHDRFFASERPAAVLKHALLEQYVLPFASKTGSTSVGSRVVYVDGYAGRGRTESGVDGSPALIMNAAKQVGSYRTLECHFVEKDRDNHDALRAMLEAEAGDLHWHTYQGSVEDHLDTLLEAAHGVPLFLFLDPFGLGITFDNLVNKVFARPRYQYAPATEVLLHFSAGAVRRIAGLLNSSRPNPGAEATMARLDQVCGGPWWREMKREAGPDNNEQFVNQVARRYMHEVVDAAKCSGAVIDVRDNPNHQPKYHLTFFTRHSDGLALFTEAASLAGDRWRRVCFDATYDEADGGLWVADELFQWEEEQLVARWTKQIRANILALLETRQRIPIRGNLGPIYGEALGEARTKHLRAVLKDLFDEGITESDQKGDLRSKVIVRRG